MLETEIKVRFCETDALGHVNNTSYFIYLEQGRTDFFEQLGTPMTLSEWPFILGHIHCDFLRQAYSNQRLIVQTGVKQIGNKSFRLFQCILDAKSNEPIAQSESVIVYFNFVSQRSEPIPDHWRQKLKAHQISFTDHRLADKMGETW
ncbi:acyl-CoA thioesterase [Paenactinomyces guangxiensis]|uniref:Acyl-CoA thioesterase n=1 Tax=Paenactinomyces guangxiensis TaxID=1490290 RepID=A0A7W1WRH0_9BACL|nr:thioesterase family protein [Paenactinomyces guangxiensis]MBA4494700.1 acyl-CoA thioesterase [Paenactinomyces guangxiensis]MBH8591784.1 acyl-CoA thioesterase [Paenactinomyces guangxiensis]